MNPSQKIWVTAPIKIEYPVTYHGYRTTLSTPYAGNSNPPNRGRCTAISAAPQRIATVATSPTGKHHHNNPTSVCVSGIEKNPATG